jgi:hypothetical protein
MQKNDKIRRRKDKGEKPVNWFSFVPTTQRRKDSTTVLDPMTQRHYDATALLNAINTMNAMNAERDKLDNRFLLRNPWKLKTNTGRYCSNWD